MSNGQYIDLDQDHKRELLVNINALFMAAFSLSEVMDVDFEDVKAELWEQAYNQISTLTDTEVERSIAALQRKHKPFDQPGEAIIQKFERGED